MKFKDYIKETEKINTAKVYILKDKKSKQYVAKGFLNWRQKEGKTNR